MVPEIAWLPPAATPEQKSQLWYINKRLAQLEYATGATMLASRPSWITLDTGSVCNLRCVQCPRENPNTPLVEKRTSQEIADRVLAATPFLERLTLHGLGEPLLSDVFWKIIEDKGTGQIPNIDVNTNGTLLSEKNVDRLLNSNLRFLRVSLDGATPETYKRIRGGNLTKVTEGIRRLTARKHELGKSEFIVWLQMTLMLENIRELPTMVELGHDLGVDALWAHHMVVRSDGTHENWRLTHDGWTFDYAEQSLSNDPALSNEMVKLAKCRADELGFTFEIHTELLLPA
jgi:MoaA/NifB/PqqE/SkfB family radical SAM enzyme